MPTKPGDILTILSFISENDLIGDVYWRCDDEYAPITFWINCNDLMAWGSSDGEDLTIENLSVLRQSIDDIETIDKVGFIYGPSLFVCRMRKQRPQGAAYPKEESLWPLFDACGPERKVELGNPYKPGQKKKALPYAFGVTLDKICREFLVENRISEGETIYQCD